ncbi:hypothetical protein BCU68_09100 [Vibrio sp. 10N.286.49.B3]|uniref:outer membrane beta-barrel protein n=1 Tax=Vibrio sp. 10N.286.49.B3 TaxID=1880855 RepID=UPI000C8552C9|nr:outer membrane beta-barrel protein [Vibrio sp. 10N.286.49.B3]PMH45942.1 hypothetical protein BCU68_09100 [Vibrio sp. 10N.286.49.B3]
MDKKRCLALAVVSTFAAFSTYAQEATHPTVYVGAKVGGGQVADMDKAVTNVTGIDKSTTAWSVFAGMRFHQVPWLALEVSYVDLGKIELKDTQGDFTATGFELAAKYVYDINEKFDVFAGVGAISYGWRGNGAACCDDNGLSGTLGFGAGYKFHPNWNALVDYKFYNNIGGSPDFHTYSIGVLYAF